MERKEKIEILRALSFGKRVAEEEVDNLKSYFVETEYWRKVFSGEADIIYGMKGTGKSAIYLLVVQHENQLFDKGVLVIPAENVRGAPAFRNLEMTPPAREPELLNIWKLYFLTLLARAAREYEFKSNAPGWLFAELERLGLLERQLTFSGILRRVRDYVLGISLEPTVHLDQHSGAPTGISVKIGVPKPSTDPSIFPIDAALAEIDKLFVEENYEAWILLDRLDVAFSDNPDLERNALRSLFRCYQDMKALNKTKLKIFLRSDIWKRISEGGFRESSHIVSDLVIRWDVRSLLNLIVRRLIENENVVESYGIDKVQITEDIEAQSALFYRIFPKLYTEFSKKTTFLEWMVEKVADGTGMATPREIIHLVSAMRDVQLRRFERGEKSPRAELLFTPEAFDEAMIEVSKVKLEHTLFAEHPTLRDSVLKLVGHKPKQTAEDLAKIWRIAEQQAENTARSLVEAGFFAQRGVPSTPYFWIPYLFRPSLKAPGSHYGLWWE